MIFRKLEDRIKAAKMIENVAGNLKGTLNFVTILVALLT